MEKWWLMVFGGLSILAFIFSLSGESKIATLSGWDDLTFPTNSLRVNPVNSKPDFDYSSVQYLFDPNDVETLIGSGQTSHSMKNNSELHCHVHWVQTAVGNVTWQLNYSLYRTGDVNNTDNWVVVSKSSVSDGDFISGTKVRVTDFPVTNNVTFLSTIFRFRVSRLGNNVNDTMSGDALFDSFDCHYLKDSLGSRGERVK